MEPPKPPLVGECCGSGCNPCVNDLYHDALDRYERALDVLNETEASVHDASVMRHACVVIRLVAISYHIFGCVFLLPCLMYVTTSSVERQQEEPFLSDLLRNNGHNLKKNECDEKTSDNASERIQLRKLTDYGGTPAPSSAV